MTTERAASDHASQEVPRELILPKPCSCSLVPDVTTPLYSSTVSYALRNALRGTSFADLLSGPRGPRVGGGGGYRHLRRPSSNSARRASAEVSCTGPTVPHLRQRAT